VRLPCGSGPNISSGSQTVQTAVTATRRQLTQLRELEAVPCGATEELTLAAGPQRIVATGNELFDVTSAAFVPVAPAPSEPAPALSTEITRWDATERTLDVGPRDEQGVLAVRENVNPGWQATLAGQVLEPVTVDGWQQGWILPPGLAGTVELRFLPDRTYRQALGVGAVGLAVVVVLAVLPGWRRSGPARMGKGRVLLGVVGAAALILFGGVAGLALLAVVSVVDALLYWWASPRLTRSLRWLGPATAYVLAGTLLAIHPWPSPDYLGGNPITQTLVLAGLAGAWVTCGFGEWLAWTVAATAARLRGSSPPPPAESPPASE
jgi:arabinofuranan 3-O-arabinosyltransferase